MPERRRRPAPIEDKAAVGRETKISKVEEGGNDEPMVVLDGQGVEMEKEVRRLRERWELASVLNFLCVFEPIMENAPKLSAEEIEMGLIRPNSSLAQLHVKLLKGIPPVSKALDCSDAWVTILCKKLNAWWPWVAEGDIPLEAVNGEEISKYKGLDPIERLLILKALCELRAEQDDAVSHVNDALKDGTQISCFRKEKVADDGNETSYCRYEGNAVIGHRLYRASVKTNLPKNIKLKMEGDDTVCLVLPPMSFQWETLATNLDEFRHVADEFASSKERAKIAFSGIIESDMIPPLQRLKKKKEKAMQRERQKALLKSCGGSYASLSFRSRRSRRHISYTFDDYDRAINEAIQVTEKRKTSEECRKQSKEGELQVEESISLGESNEDTNSNSKGHSPSSKTLIDEHKVAEADDDDNVDDDDGADGEYDGMEEEESEASLDLHEPDNEHDSLGNRKKAPGVRWSKRLAEVTNQTAEETMKAKTRNLLRQRLVRNLALDSMVVPDSDEEN